MKVIKNNADDLQSNFIFFSHEQNIKNINFTEDLQEAVEDSRNRRNLHGPFNSAEEAVASMLED